MNDQNQPQKPEESSSGSLLDRILSEPARELTPEERAALEEKERADAAAAGKKPKRKLTLKEIWYRFLALSFAASVIVASTAAYVIFNPDQAVFLKSLFGIAIGDVAKILGIVFLWAFYVIIAFGLAGWLYLIFRAVLAKKFKGTGKYVLVVSAIFLGFMVNGAVLAGYQVVRSRLQNLEYVEAKVELYDNDIYKVLDGDKSQALIRNASRLIGPVTVRFDLSPYIQRIRNERGLVAVNSYSVNFGDGTKPVSGQVSKNAADNFVLHAFSRPKVDHPYEVRGSVTGRDARGQAVDIQMPPLSLSVVAEVRVDEVPQPEGGILVSFDATDLREYGRLEWFVESSAGSGTVKESDSYQYTPSRVFTGSSFVWMKLYEGDTPTDFRYFVIQGEAGALIAGRLDARPDPVDYRKYKFSLENLAFKQGALAKVQWFVGATPAGNATDMEYSFAGPGDYAVRAVVTDTSGNSKSFPRRVTITDPVAIKAGYGLKMYDESNAEKLAGTYDDSTASYLVSGVTFPQEVSFDAKDVKADSARLRLASTDWDLDGDGNFEATGSHSAKLLLSDQRPYTVHALYRFREVGSDAERTYQDTVVISPTRLPFDVRLKVVPESEYAPSKVLLDATASQAAEGEIVNFEFDYGDGSRPAQSSRGQITHVYVQPGLYAAKVTAFKGNGERKSATKNFTLRRQQNVATIVTSVSRGRTGMPVNFDAKASRGSPVRISWKFGDGQAAEGESATHTYYASGSYDVSLEIQYSDGTVERDARKFEVLYRRQGE